MRSSMKGIPKGEEIHHASADQREVWIEEIFDGLHVLSNLIEEHSREIEKLTGLNKNQALTIKAVSRSTSTCASELARSIYLKPPAMVRILDQLEEQGLIHRTRSKEDRRVVRIGTTEKTKDVVVILRNISHNNIVNGIGGKDDRELQNIMEALRKFLSLLGAADVGPSRLSSAKF